MASRTIYVLFAQTKSTYSSDPPKVLQAFTDEDEAMKTKDLIDGCGPKYEIVVTPVTLVDTGVKPVALKSPPNAFWPEKIFVGDRTGPPSPAETQLYDESFMRPRDGE